MEHTLFQFHYRCQPRRKKPRGVLRRASSILRDARQFKVNIAPNEWFCFSHQHLDWNGVGDLGPRIRLKTLEAHALVFRAYALALSRFDRPFQLWLSFGMSDAGQDAVYCHSANLHSKFPAEFDDVTWGNSSLEALLCIWLPEFRLVVGVRDWNYVIFAEGIGVPLSQSKRLTRALESTTLVVTISESPAGTVAHL